MSYFVDENDKDRTINKNCKSLGCGKIACGYCSKDLNEDGLFPEELKLSL